MIHRAESVNGFVFSPERNLGVTSLMNLGCTAKSLQSPPNPYALALPAVGNLTALVAHPQDMQDRDGKRVAEYLVVRVQPLGLHHNGCKLPRIDAIGGFRQRRLDDLPNLAALEKPMPRPFRVRSTMIAKRFWLPPVN
jgi:hypothetical protein